VDVNGDQPRFLAPVAGYTPVAHQSIDPTCEALDASYLQKVTSEAHRRWARDRRRRWGQAAAALGVVVEDLSRSGDRALQSDLRALSRMALRVSARLDRELDRDGL
jgi:hypothetical protein